MVTEKMAKENVLQDVITILNEITGDWEMEFAGPISQETKIISDLEFESIDVVQLVVQIEGFYKRKDLPFEKMLMRDGRYLEDITVNEVTDFLQTYL